jgi:hypothetical protein
MSSMRAFHGCSSTTPISTKAEEPGQIIDPEPRTFAAFALFDRERVNCLRDGRQLARVGQLRVFTQASMVIRSAFSIAALSSTRRRGPLSKRMHLPPQSVLSSTVAGAVHRIGGAVLGLRRGAGGILLQVVDDAVVRVPGIGIVRLGGGGIAVVDVDPGVGDREQTRDPDLELDPRRPLRRR